MSGKNTAGLSADFIGDIRSRLEQELAETSQELGCLEAPDCGGTRGDGGDQATDYQARSERESRILTLVARRVELEAALVRVKGGNYGLCEKCQLPIEAERLMAYPLARHHIAHVPKKRP